MEPMRGGEHLLGVKAIYRNGDMIYRDPTSFADDTTERPASYDAKKSEEQKPQ